ncbi:hypothetical protein ACQBAU_17505 [Propionibacteriaceae bacterium Y2011]|uniref:hypothetical protein n=1 Tax=Microlunatus sp. Y2014 TaxID=3418488 RepID=UPI003B45BD4B
MTEDKQAAFDAYVTQITTEDYGAVTDIVKAVRKPGRPPAAAIRVLDSWYLQQAKEASMRAAGANLPLSGDRMVADDARASLRRTAIYLMALTELHGLDISDVERRKTLVAGILLGEEGADMASSVLLSQGGRWAQSLATGRAVSMLGGGNPLVGMMLGRIVDGGMSAAMAGGSEAVRAQAVVMQARKAFGEPPDLFPGQRRVKPKPEPTPKSAIYARALARTIHKARKRAGGSE